MQTYQGISNNSLIDGEVKRRDGFMPFLKRITTK